MNRRVFAKQTTLGSMGLVLSPQFTLSQTTYKDFVSKRPPKQERRFTSKAIEKVIKKVKKQLKDPELTWLFENCFPNTLDTTVFYKEEKGRPLSHIITGDINAMWLRDSTCQVWQNVCF